MLRIVCFVFALSSLLLPLQAQQRFWTDTPHATAYNGSRNIALDPVTGWLHIVYEVAGQIRYSYSTNNGLFWSPTEVVSPSMSTYPSIVCENQGPNPVWVSYVHGTETQTQIFTSARVGPGLWLTHTVCPAGAWAAPGPSMAMCYDQSSPINNPSVYVVHGDYARTGTDMSDFIVFDKVSLLYGVSTTDHFVVAQTTRPDESYGPSVATTPGDWVSVAWQWYVDTDNNGRVMYRQRDHGSWLVPEYVSLPSQPGAEPAWLPSVEAYADSVHVVWRGYNEQVGVSDIWKRPRLPNLPGWYNFANRSQTPSSPSQYPEQSTHWATVWQDGQPGIEGILANLFGNVVTIYADGRSSGFPSIAAEWSPLGQPPMFWLHAVWTNKTEPGQPWPYEVKYQFVPYIPPPFGSGDFVYYDCGVGESVPSAYCLARDGHARWGGYSVDFAKTNLKYRLPYLNPNYDYKLRVVLYQTSKDTWEQTFAVDTTRLAKVRFSPNVPETVVVSIPRHLYARDCRVNINVNRILGKYAAVAELRLYECFPYREGEGKDGVTSESPPAAVALRLTRPSPSPFKTMTNISYAVSAGTHVLVKVFDSQGRQVRLLSSGFANPGVSTQKWDGRDDKGVLVPAGAYIIRAECGSSAQAAKVVVER
jgi:hypothetical protein